VTGFNARSDVGAKEAFIEELLRRGFEEARVTGSPADITALKGTDTYYFEVKYTAQESRYFGAATLTEWEAALAHEDRYRFVVATKRDFGWLFHEYTPAEFMEFSYIPPFKIFFHVGVGVEKAMQPRRGEKRVQLSRDRIELMLELFRKFRGPA